MFSVTQQIDHAFAMQAKRIQDLEAKAKYWEDRYWAEIYRSIEHSEVTMANFITAAIGGVISKEP